MSQDLSASVMNPFFGTKQYFQALDHSPQVPDYSDLQIIGHEINGILLYILNT